MGQGICFGGRLLALWFLFSSWVARRRDSEDRSGSFFLEDVSVGGSEQ